jgi:tetratricopeptide (TPR) repeat protein
MVRTEIPVQERCEKEIDSTVTPLKKMKRNRIILILFFQVALTLAVKSQQVRGPIAVAQNDHNQYDTTYALVVGISKYQNIQSLQYADADAKAFYDFLRSPAGGKVDSANIKLLLNENAKAQNITTALSWLCKRASAHTRIFVYFACHGDSYDEQEAFLLAYDAPPGGDDNLYITGGTIQVFNLKNRVKYMTSKSAEVVLITDACRTNDLPGKVNGVRYTNAKIMEENAGEIQFSSCSANQTSMEGSGWGGGRGLFSYHLVNGLYGLADKDNDGNVSWFELKNYVIDSVRADSKTSSGSIRQTPTFFCEDAKIDRVIEHVDPQSKAKILLAMHPVKPKPHAHADYVTRSALLHFDDYQAEQDYLRFQEELKKQHYVTEESNISFSDALAYEGNSAEQGDASDNTVDGYVSTDVYTEEQNTDEENNSSLQEEVSQTNQDCAFSELNKLLHSSKVSEERKSDLKDMYIDEVMNYCQDLINDYLGGDRRILSPAVMSNAAGAMKSLNGLVVFEGNDRDNFMGKYFFFMAREEMLGNHAEQFRLGISYCDSSIKYQPDAAYIYNTRAMLHGSLGEFDLGNQDINRAMKLAPNWVFPMVGMAVLETKFNHEQEAIAWYKKAITADPAFSLAYDRMAIIYHNQYSCFGGNYDSLAFDCLRKSITIAPQYSEPYAYLGGAYALYHKTDSALFYMKIAYEKDSTDWSLSEALGNFYSSSNPALAEKYYKESLEREGDSSEIYSDLGQLIEKNGNDSLAYEYYKKAFRINKWNENALTNLTGYWHKYNADDVSIKFINNLITIDSTKDYLFRLKGNIYLQKADAFSARVNYLKAYRINPSSQENLLNLIHFYAKTNPGDPAYLILLHRGDSIMPRNEEMCRNKMEYQIIKGNTDSAYALIAYYNEQIERYNSLKYFAGQICTYRKKYAEAIAWYEKAGKSDPQSDYRLYIANTLVDQGNFSAAIKVAREQVDVHPGNAEGKLLLANLYLQSGFADSAIVILNTTKPAAEKEYQKNFILGCSYQLLGNTKAAKYYFENSITEKPDFASPYFYLSQIYSKEPFKKGKAKKYLRKFNELNQVRK